MQPEGRNNDMNDQTLNNDSDRQKNVDNSSIRLESLGMNEMIVHTAFIVLPLSSTWHKTSSHCSCLSRGYLWPRPTVSDWLIFKCFTVIDLGHALLAERKVVMCFDFCVMYMKDWINSEFTVKLPVD